MADNDIAIRLIVRADGTAVISNVAGSLDELGKKAKDTAKETESMFTSMLKANIVASAIQKVSGFLIDSASRMMELGDALSETNAGFSALTQRAGIDAVEALNNMRTGADGMLTDLNLMKIGSDILGTGLQITAGQMGDLTAVAKTLGEVHGKELPEAMSIFTSAIERGSDKALLALGVDIDLKSITDKLGNSATEAEKKQAFFNAALEKAKQAAEGASAGGESFHDTLIKLRVSWDNWLAGTGEATNSSQTLATATRVLIEALKTLGGWIGSVAKLLWDDLVGVFEMTADSLRSASEAFIKFLGVMEKIPGFGWAKDLKQDLQDLLSGFDDMGKKSSTVGKTIIPDAMNTASTSVAGLKKATDEAKKANDEFYKNLQQEIKDTSADAANYFGDIEVSIVDGTQKPMGDAEKAAAKLYQAFQKFGIESTASIDALANSATEDFSTIVNSSNVTGEELKKSIEAYYSFMASKNREVPAEFDLMYIAIESQADKTNHNLIAGNEDAAAKSTSAWDSFKTGFAGIMDTIAGNFKNIISGLISGTVNAGNALTSIFTSIFDGIGSKIGSSLSGIFKNMGGLLGSISGPLGSMIGSAIGAIGGAIVGLFKKLFAGKSPEATAISDVMRDFGQSIGKDTAAEITKAIAARFGTEKLATKVAIGIYLPEVQLILIKDQLKTVTTAIAEDWASRWVSTRAVLINDLHDTAEQAAAEMQPLMQAVLTAMQKTGAVVGPELANWILWARQMGQAFDTAGLQIENAAGKLVDFGKYLNVQMAKQDFTSYLKQELANLVTAFEDFKNRLDFSKIIKGSFSTLSTVFSQIKKKILDLKKDMQDIGMTDAEITAKMKDLGAEVMPLLQLASTYTLSTLKQMDAMGKGTTEVWNAVGSSMQQQLSLMKQLGMEDTKLFKELNKEYQELKHKEDTIKALTGPMVDYFKALDSAGQITAKNFDQYVGQALGYMQQLIKAGATTSEVWGALSQVFELLKEKHDAIGIKEDSPIYKALEKMYESYKKLQGVTTIMDSLNAMSTLLGKNMFNTGQDIETWGTQIHQYFNEMIKGGMSLQQIVGQYGGTLHQLYLEYQAQGKDVPGWLQKVEHEYEIQQKAQDAANQAQRDMQIAMLEGFAAIIKALGGDVPAAIQEAIDALKRLGDQGKISARGPVDIGKDMAAAFLNAASAINAAKTAYNNMHAAMTSTAQMAAANVATAYKSIPSTVKTQIDLNVPHGKNLGQFEVDRDKVELHWQPLSRGMDYIPYDGYRALLHKGEGVLNSYDNRQYQSSQNSYSNSSSSSSHNNYNGGGVGQSAAINVNITTFDSQGVEDVVKTKVIPALNRALQNNTQGFKSFVSNAAN